MATMTDEEVLAHLNEPTMTDEEVLAHLSDEEKKWGHPSFLEGLGTVLDYPIAPVRGAVGGLIESIKHPSEESPVLTGIGKVLEGAAVPLLEGPSAAPTAAQIAESLGVPPGPVAEGVGLAIDLAAGIPGSAIAGKMIGAPAKILNLANQEEKALRAIGASGKILEGGLQRYAKDTAKELPALAEFAKEKVITPFTTTKSMLGKVQQKLDVIGERIGTLRNEAADAAEKWLINNSGTQAAQNILEEGFHLGSGFQGSKTRERIVNKLAGFGVADPLDKQKIMKVVDDRLEALGKELGGTNPSIEQLADLKKGWQDQVSWGPPLPEMKNSDIALNLLQSEANRAIDAEMEFIGKHLSNPASKKEYLALKKEFGQYANVEEGLIKKRVSEIRNIGKATPGFGAINPLSYVPIQTALAKVPDITKYTGPLARAGTAAVRVSPLLNMIALPEKPLTPSERALRSNELNRSPAQ